MEPLVREIVDTEWDLFDKVRNRGGRAACQDDANTFFIMRSSQLAAWTTAMRESYFCNLQAAKRQGRNPLAEKYGYMMERTSPEEYAEICGQLPFLNEEKRQVIDTICAVQVAWLETLSRYYPGLTRRGRAIHQSADTLWTTSFETYLRGELSTYSMNTLGLYWNYVVSLQAAGENMNEMVLRNTVEQYGFSSLEEAERQLRGS